MAIIYDWFENPKREAEEETTLHARPCFNGTVNTKTLARLIQQRCSLTPGDVLAVLNELNEVIGYELREGRQVHIDGLGFFDGGGACHARHPTDEAKPHGPLQGSSIPDGQ